MRLNNYKKEGLYNFINTLAVLIIAGGIFAFFLNFKFNILPVNNFVFLAISMLTAFVYYLAGRQIFEYDSDGEALNFKNKTSVHFLFKDASDEFPKYKVKDFQMVSFPFYGRLYVILNSKRNANIKLKYDITYLTSKEKKDLTISLKKVVAANSKNDTDL